MTSLIDTSGDPLERILYRCYGEPNFLDGSFASRSSSNYQWNNLFAAGEYDADVGAYVLRFRLLQHALGRFLSRDPWGEAHGTMSDVPTLHYYLYTTSNPTNATDPYGLQDERPAQRLARKPPLLSLPPDANMWKPNDPIVDPKTARQPGVYLRRLFRYKAIEPEIDGICCVGDVEIRSYGRRFFHPDIRTGDDRDPMKFYTQIWIEYRYSNLDCPGPVEGFPDGKKTVRVMACDFYPGRLITSIWEYTNDFEPPVKFADFTDEYCDGIADVIPPPAID